MLDPKFAIVGTLIGSAGALCYLWSTIRGRVRPNRVSFLLWSIAPTIAFAAQLEQGGGLEALMTFSTGFLPLLTFLASFASPGAAWKLSRFDLACGALSVLGLAAWRFTGSGTAAIAFSIAADALAAAPTLAKAYKRPDTEIAWPWLATCAGVALTLATLERWTFANSAFILYIFVVDFAIYACVAFRPKARVDGRRRAKARRPAGKLF